MEEKFNLRKEIEKMFLRVLDAAEQRNETLRKQTLKENLLDEWLNQATTDEKEQALLMFMEKGDRAKDELRKQLDKHLEILSPQERKESLDIWMQSLIYGGNQ